MKPYFLFSGLMVGGALLTVASVQASASAPEMTPFHTQAQAVDSHYYLPPPPKDGSPALTYDKAAYQEGYAMKGTPRWQQATQDANLHVDNMAKIFSPVLGVTISASKTPATWSMLQNLLIMGGDYAPDAAKNSTCVPVLSWCSTITPASLLMKPYCVKTVLIRPATPATAPCWRWCCLRQNLSGLRSLLNVAMSLVRAG